MVANSRRRALALCLAFAVGLLQWANPEAPRQDKARSGQLAPLQQKSSLLLSRSPGAQSNPCAATAHGPGKSACSVPDSLRGAMRQGISVAADVSAEMKERARAVAEVASPYGEQGLAFGRQACSRLHGLAFNTSGCIKTYAGQAGVRAYEIANWTAECAGARACELASWTVDCVCHRAYEFANWAECAGARVCEFANSTVGCAGARAYKIAKWIVECSRAAWAQAERHNTQVWAMSTTTVVQWGCALEQKPFVGVPILAAGPLVLIGFFTFFVKSCLKRRRLRIWTNKVYSLHSVRRGASQYHLLYTDRIAQAVAPSAESVQQELTEGMPVEVLTDALLPQPRLLRFVARRKVLYTEDMRIYINDLSAIQVGSRCDVVRQTESQCSRWSPSHCLGLVCTKGTIVVILPEPRKAALLADELASCWSACGRIVPVLGEQTSREAVVKDEPKSREVILMGVAKPPIAPIEWESEGETIDTIRRSAADTARRDNGSLDTDRRSDAETAREDGSHRFARRTFTEATWCQVCDRFLWGLSYQGFRCVACALATCEDCAKSEMKLCPGKPPRVVKPHI